MNKLTQNNVLWDNIINPKNMKAHLILIFMLMISMTTFSQTKKNLYDFKVETITGETFDLSSLKGKKVMVVNTASKCGLTPQYEGLQALYEKYGDGNFTIIGFPANNFMSQEPGTNEEILEFCTANYGVEFPMMSKISVKGDDMHELYKWLTSESENGVMDSEVGWNFQKYLIDENGNLVDIMPPRTKPDDPKIIAWIEGK
jgi:glutathione peroxidase